MTLTITDRAISSGHAVRSVPGRPHAWEVSRLPGQFLDRNTAITAMMPVDTADDARRDERPQLCPAIHNWAAELGLTEPDAAAQASQPPDQIKGSGLGTARPGSCQTVSERDQWRFLAGSGWSAP